MSTPRLVEQSATTMDSSTNATGSSPRVNRPIPRIGDTKMPTENMTRIWIRAVMKLGTILPTSSVALLMGAASKRRKLPHFFSS